MIKVCSKCGEEFESDECIDWSDEMCFKCRYEDKDVIKMYNERY